jgi:hypothetical protein
VYISLKEVRLRFWGVAQVIEHLSSKLEALSSIPSITNQTKQNPKQQQQQNRIRGLGCSSVIDCLPSMLKALSSIPSTVLLMFSFSVIVSKTIQNEIPIEGIL